MQHRKQAKRTARTKISALLLSLLLLCTVTVQGTLAFISTETKAIKNIFTPSPIASSDLIISKMVEHPFGEDYEIPDSIAFDFEIQLGEYYKNYTFETTVGAVTADQNGTLTVSVKPDAPLGIKGIDENTAVTVTEMEKENDGFAVKDGSGAKTVTVTADTATRVDFINVYTPAAVSPVNVKLIGSKTLTGRDWKADDTFTFVIEQQNSDGTWKTLGEETVTAAQKDFDFSSVLQALTFDAAGTYTFRLTEQKGDLVSVAYDTAARLLDITVGDKDMDGKLEIQNVTGSKNLTVTAENGSYTVNAAFENTYTPPVTTTTATTGTTTASTTVGTTQKTIGTTDSGATPPDTGDHVKTAPFAVTAVVSLLAMLACLLLALYKQYMIPARHSK